MRQFVILFVNNHDELMQTVVEAYTAKDALADLAKTTPENLTRIPIGVSRIGAWTSEKVGVYRTGTASVQRVETLTTVQYEIGGYIKRGKL